MHLVVYSIISSLICAAISTWHLKGKSPGAYTSSEIKLDLEIFIDFLNQNIKYIYIIYDYVYTCMHVEFYLI
jgi:hypothetical protein